MFPNKIEPITTPIPEFITVEWNEEGEGSVKIHIEKEGIFFGNVITYCSRNAIGISLTSNPY